MKAIDKTHCSVHVGITSVACDIVLYQGDVRLHAKMDEAGRVQMYAFGENWYFDSPIHALWFWRDNNLKG